MLVRFLFWNLGKKQLASSIARLAVLHHVDVFVFAENNIRPVEMLLALNTNERATFHFNTGLCEKIAIFSRFANAFFEPIFETSRLTIRRFNPPALTEILVVATHLPSKVNWNDDSLALEATQLSRDIRDTEDRVRHDRTLVVGDLNMNPFEAGVVGAAALHAVMDSRVASNGSRIVQGRRYPYFYNPMWGRLGDRTEAPPGTHFHYGSEHVEYFWNTYDQVLIRPSLLPRFLNADLRILSTDGTSSFLSRNGVPNSSAGSDHLPILFTLDL